MEIIEDDKLPSIIAAQSASQTRRDGLRWNEERYCFSGEFLITTITSADEEAWNVASPLRWRLCRRNVLAFQETSNKCLWVLWSCVVRGLAREGTINCTAINFLWQSHNPVIDSINQVATEQHQIDTQWSYMAYYIIIALWKSEMILGLYAVQWTMISIYSKGIS